jgi:hypothetical protein
LAYVRCALADDLRRVEGSSDFLTLVPDAIFGMPTPPFAERLPREPPPKRLPPAAATLAGVAVVIVDAENVRRSQWPNLTRAELVARARAWAQREGHELLVVFDGEPPEDARDLVGAASADDEIVTIGATIDGPWWLVSSDRGLRERVGDGPERIVGGGTFVRGL